MLRESTLLRMMYPGRVALPERQKLVLIRLYRLISRAIIPSVQGPIRGFPAQSVLCPRRSIAITQSMVTALPARIMVYGQSILLRQVRHRAAWSSVV